MSDAESLVGKEIGQFKLEKFISQGSVGLVFKGTDTILIRDVALKLIAKKDDHPYAAEARRRFVHEAQAAGQLYHPNIVTIHSYGETEDYQYICMEFLEGKTLAEILQEQKRLSLGSALDLLRQVLSALEASYRAGIVHRDIKPSNLMITAEGRLKVMDFGIAKLPSLSATAAGAVLGTPYYMSPEQITGKTVDIRSDIFSVGAVLYQAITGERPFEAESSTALTYLIVNVDPPPPNLTVSNIPDRFCGIIRKAMAKDPAQRYQIPSEMLEELVAAEGNLIPESDIASQFGKTVRSGEAGFVSMEEKESGHTEPEQDAPANKEPDSLPPVRPTGVPDLVLSSKAPVSWIKAAKTAMGRASGKKVLVCLVLLFGAASGIYLFSTGILKGLPYRAGSVLTGPTSTHPSQHLPQNLPFEGRYLINGISPNGARYQGTAILSRSGSRFFITWNIANKAFSGSGTLSGNQLSIYLTQTSGPGDLITYIVSPNGVLMGVRVQGKGSEILTPIR